MHLCIYVGKGGISGEGVCVMMTLLVINLIQQKKGWEKIKVFGMASRV